MRNAVKLFPALFSILFLGCGRNFTSRRFFYLGTYVDVTIPEKSRDRVFPLIEEEMKNVEKLLNLKSGPSAELNKTGRVKNGELAELLRFASDASEKTGGIFDVTIETVLRSWGFSPVSSGHREPSGKEIKDALKRVDFRRIKINGDKISAPGTKVNFGSMGKGYLLLRIRRILENERIKNALVDAGGDILAMGKGKRGKWKIGIRDPFSDGISGIVELTNLAVATSGDYENFFVKDGKKYNHILSPKTGRPAEKHQVTVIASDPVNADIYSTAFMLMENKTALEIAGALGLGVMMIDERGKVWKNKIFCRCEKL
ncbi:MAG: FAD:protein FMN transferase [bacterium]